MNVARSDLAPQSNSVLSRNVSLGELNTKVTGPESSTDNAIPRFSGIYGKEIQNSGITIDALNNISGVTTLTLSATLTTPLIVSSTVLVSNLNVDLLDGKHASDFSLSTHTHTLSDLTDTNLTTVADGDVLIWNATTNKWEAGEPGTTINNLSDVSDIILTSIADGEILRWDSINSKWINTTTAINTTQIATVGVYTGTTNPTLTTRVNINGYVYATRVYNAVFNDYAECFYSDYHINVLKYRIVEIENNKVQLAKEKSEAVVGVVSTTYGFLLYGSEEEIQQGVKVPVGMAGTVLVDSEQLVDKQYLYRFVCSGIDGKARVIPKGEAYLYEGCIVGKIIDINIVTNQYMLLIALN